MRLPTRRLLNQAFTALALLSVVAVAMILLVVLSPIFVRGAGAYVFRGTIEHRRFLIEQFDRGDASRVSSETAAAVAARAPVYEILARFEQELNEMPAARRRDLRADYREVRKTVDELLGPAPGAPAPLLPRKAYGQTRWDRAQVKLDRILFRTTWDYSAGLGREVRAARESLYAGTSLAPLFPLLRDRLDRMLLPRLTFYGGFLTDRSVDSHLFGGIGPEVLGTVYLTLGAMLLAVPFGIVAAIYFQEYAREGRVRMVLRTCVGTLAGVPSVLFGLFGLAFFINTLHVSPGKSVLAGALTLALLVLPTIIRAAEEAIASVPGTFKEAALALGAGRWHAIRTVILPAALPGILTGIVISMGRAAGETAPIIFTAAVSFGAVPRLAEVFTHATPALPWNIFNLATEHEAAEEIRHVQYGMVATLVLIVLLLNLGAVCLRARVSRRLRG